MILIRSDANEHIGTGHIMRCLTIARVFVAKRETLRFVTADHSVDALIHRVGFESICLNSRWEDLSGEDIGGIVREYRPKLVLVDSYFVTPTYFDRLAAEARVAYMDDLNDNCWNVDCLINYNIFAPSLDYSACEKTRTKLMLGPAYAPLRNEFRGMGERRIKPVSDIFVSAGGADPACITESIIDRICPGFPNVVFHIVVGALNPRIDNISSMSKHHDNVRLHIREQHMSELMRCCDMAISAAGSTLYELCACGTPTITYTMADNQLLAEREFCKQGIMLSAGDLRGDDGFVGRLEEQIQKMKGDETLRRRLSLSMQSMVDGYGAERIAEGLLY